MENGKELTQKDLKTIVIILRTVADMKVLSDADSEKYGELNLRSIADRAMWTLINGIQIKE